MDEKVARFKEIQEEMDSLLDEALDIVVEADMPSEVKVAKAYWYAQIQSILTENSDYSGGSMHGMDKSAEALEEKLGEQEHEDGLPPIARRRRMRKGGS